MESKKRGWDQNSENRTITRTCYNNRKESLKKKTMELATLCGINACTIIHGRDGEIKESWPENPTEAKAIIKNFKDLMNNPNKKAMVRDESMKKDVVVLGGEVGSCSDGIIQKLEYHPYPKTTTTADESHEEDFVVPDENTDSVHLGKMMEKRLLIYSSQSSLTGYQQFLMQLDSKIEALNKRIVFLRKDQQNDTKSCSTKKNSCITQRKHHCSHLISITHCWVKLNISYL